MTTRIAQMGWLGILLLLTLFSPPPPRAEEPPARVPDQKFLAEAKTGSEIMTNLTYLCDEIGPRLTGSANLKRACEWAAGTMKKYGLVNVHLEPWSLPEGWERGPATARLIEPDNGLSLSVASLAWTPGTSGKVAGDVVVVVAFNTKELAAYKGKLKGAVVLLGAPQKLLPLAELDRPLGRPGRAFFPDKLSERPPEERLEFFKERSAFLAREGAAVVLTDAGKPFGLHSITGGWRGTDRPSAVNRVPILSVAHNHYELLHRLVSRPAPARTRIEVEISNKFLPGPIAVHNVVGEIRGSDRAEEVVIAGAHLDSWDLGQGATDNGTGSVVVLEAARILAKSGVRPRRTLRFILFTGEEQGLHGSRAYVEQHKDEMPRTSACLIHDTGTGKVTGIGARHRPALRSLLEKELASLRDLGVTDMQADYIAGSDQFPFEKAGVPGLMFTQEIAGYRLNHHSQADTLERAVEASLVQGAQVMAITALRFANLDRLLPREFREKPEPKEHDREKPARRIELDDLAKTVGLSDPQISPDGKSIVVVVSRANVEKNRHDRELVLIDIATSGQRVLTHERTGVSHPRWSPSGDRLAFLAISGSGKEAHHQLFVMPMNGGDARKLTSAGEGVQQFAWSPDGKQFAFVAEDEAEKKKDADKHNDAFEVGDNEVLATSAPRSSHLWLVAEDGSKSRRLTSGTWSLPVIPPPGSPASPIVWTPDGKAIVFVRQAKPHFGNADQTTIQFVQVADGSMRSLTKRSTFESYPILSPDGSHLAYWYPRDDDPNNVNEIWLSPASGGEGKSLTRKLDRNIQRALWMPDGKSLLLGGHDQTRVALWLQPLDGPTRRLDLGKVDPSWMYWVDVMVGKNGGIAFTGSESHRPTELYYLPSPESTPRRLTDFNKHIAGLGLGKVEPIAWKGPDRFEEDGVLTYPPDFSPKKKYPLVLVIHGGPTSASTEQFSALNQLIASHGYVVFSPNYRGSDNLGNAYQRAIFNDAGAGPGRDVMAGIEAIKKRGFVDEKRIAVTGWSYGGYMTTWLIGNYDIWKTAIAGAAVTDKNDQYNLADFNVTERYTVGGSPWVGNYEKAYRDQSPITYARNIKTPTLILATTGDARVPITQSYKLYHALKDNKVPVKFVAYPVSGHYPGDPVRQRDLFRRWVSWLDEHLRG